MKTVLVVDDLRSFPLIPNATYARTSAEGLSLLEAGWDAIILDHDLGLDRNVSGMLFMDDIKPVVLRLVELAIDGEPPTDNIIVVTSNVVGRHYITSSLEGYYNVVQAFGNRHLTLDIPNLVW